MVNLLYKTNLLRNLSIPSRNLQHRKESGREAFPNLKHRSIKKNKIKFKLKHELYKEMRNLHHQF